MNIERFPILKDKKVLIVDAVHPAGELAAELCVNQQTQPPDFIKEEKFPYDFPGHSSFKEYVEVRKPDLIAIHIPGVATENGARNYRQLIDDVRLRTPLVILEGFPATDETVNMYEKMRTDGIPMARKDDHGAITKIFADLLSKKIT